MSLTSLPPGFRFHPTDPELIKYYLKRKVLGKKLACDVIAEVDIYKNEPWDLPDKSYLPSRDLKWYFFCPREKKYSIGGRLNRATERGYWKTTGKDRPVVHNAKHVGMIKTLVFHQGRAPKGDRTDWVMHEYRLDEKDLADTGVVQDTFVLCIVFHKEGPGPRNGAQYGAPFKDEWSSDDEDIINCADKALSEHQPSQPFMLLPPTQSYSEVTTTPVSENVSAYQPAPFVPLPTRSHSEVTTMSVSDGMCNAPIPEVTTMSVSDGMCNAPIPGSARSEILPPAGELVPVAEDIDFSNLDLSQILQDGDFFSMSDLLQDDHGSDPTRNYVNENYDIFEGLEDLESSIQLKDLEKPL